MQLGGQFSYSVVQTQTILLRCSRMIRNEVAVVYFDQLSGAACTRKLVELLFTAIFNLFCFKSEVRVTLEVVEAV